MYSDLLVYHRRTHLEAMFHFRGTLGLVAVRLGMSSLQPGIRYVPMKRSSGRPMLRQRNEPSPTTIPRAITYSIKFLVSLPVIVMNMQAAYFFVSQSQMKETLGVEKACELIGSLLATGQTGGG